MPGPKIFKSINQIPAKIDLLIELISTSLKVKIGGSSANLTPHPIHYLFDISKRESAEFINSRIDHAVLFEDHHELLRYAVSKASGDIFWEFGVYIATSTNIIANEISPRIVKGFDSFQGLREDWTGHTFLAGAFDLKSKLPDVRSNVDLVPGWIQDTISQELEKLKEQKICFVHFDLDTYESTKFALESITPHIANRAIFVFDEYHSYPGWKHGEKKAFEEWLLMSKAEHRFIGFSWEQAVVEIQMNKAR